MKEINRIISKNINKYIKALGITQIDLAERLDCANTTVSMWIQGNSTPRMDKIDKMCEIFHCTRSDLVSENTKSENDILDDQIRAEFLNTIDTLTSAQKLRALAYLKSLIKKGDKNED